MGLIRVYKQISVPSPAGEGFSEGEGLCSPCDTRRNLSGGYPLDTYHTRLDQRLNATAQADLSEDVRPTPSRPGEGIEHAFCDRRCELNRALCPWRILVSFITVYYTGTTSSG